jgi:hypothetical protein
MLSYAVLFLYSRMYTCIYRSLCDRDSEKSGFSNDVYSTVQLECKASEKFVYIRCSKQCVTSIFCKILSCLTHWMLGSCIIKESTNKFHCNYFRECLLYNRQGCISSLFQTSDLKMMFKKYYFF